MVDELGFEVNDFQRLFRPLLAGAGVHDEVFCCRLALLRFEDFKSLRSEAHDLILLGRTRNFWPGRGSAGTSCGSNQRVDLPGRRILFLVILCGGEVGQILNIFEVGIVVWNLGLTRFPNSFFI